MAKANLKTKREALWRKVPLLTMIGGTPLLPLDLFAKEASKLEVFLKCEWVNPGGSLKDRPVRQMLIEALLSGELRPGKTILDSSSGNAGIAYAMLGAALGYPVEIVIPGNASKERLDRLRAHGATLTLTDPMLGYDEAIRVAHQKAHDEAQKYFLPNQYANEHNWRSHYEGTAKEILKQTDGKISYFVCGVGTGGSLTGIGRRLKEKNKKIQVIAITPERFPGIEGLKPLGEPEDFVPPILDESVIDRRIPVTIEQAAEQCAHLAKRGIFCGQSTGGYLAAVAQLAKEKIKGRVVTLACDTGERYFSTGLWSAS